MKLAKQVYPLTSLRFFAALLVVLHHTLDSVMPAIERHGWSARLQTFSGSTVLLFFILSGYVLALVYLEPGTAIDWKNFWRARFARIYPLYLIALLLDTPTLLHARVLKYGVSAALLKTSVTFAGSCLLLQQWLPVLKGIDSPTGRSPSRLCSMPCSRSWGGCCGGGRWRCSLEVRRPALSSSGRRICWPRRITSRVQFASSL